jgi:hypothetical protein
MADLNPEEEPRAGRTKTCFVIGPIGDRFADAGSDSRIVYEDSLAVWEEVILPACVAVGLDPVRADGLARAGEITNQIFRRLRDDDVVIADLTGANANVMYELGLRHTRDRLTLQVGEYGRLPFDVNVIRTVQFSRSPRGLINARDELIEILRPGLEGQYDPVSATRIWAESEEPGRGGGDAGPLSDGAEPGPDDPAGFIDLVAAAEDRYGELTESAELISADISSMGRLAESATTEMHESDSRGAGMRGRLAVAARFASRLNDVAGELESHVGQYAEAMETISAGTLALIEQVETNTAELQDDQVQNWALTTRRLAKTVRESLASLNGMSSSMQANARLSRVLRPATRRVTDSFARLENASSEVDEWDRRLQTLGVGVPADDWEPNWNTGTTGPGDSEDGSP